MIVVFSHCLVSSAWVVRPMPQATSGSEACAEILSRPNTSCTESCGSNRAASHQDRSDTCFGLGLASHLGFTSTFPYWPRGQAATRRGPLPAGDSAPAHHGSLLPAETAGSDKPAPYFFQPLTVLAADKTSSDNKQYQKLRLLQSVAGLDRGFGANAAAAALVESAVLALTGTGEPVTLSWTPGELLLRQEPNTPGRCSGEVRNADGRLEGS